jgi:hypothetical protein
MRASLIASLICILSASSALAQSAPFGGSSSFGTNTNIYGGNAGTIAPGYGYGYGGIPYGGYAVPGAVGSTLYGRTPFGGYVGVPMAPVPVAMPGIGGYFRIGRVPVSYWMAPSGYYYPWGFNTTGSTIYSLNSPIYFVSQGAANPQVPPLSAVFTDLDKFLTESKSKGRVKDADYISLTRRLKDLQSKQDHMMSVNGGTMDASDEESIRRDLDTFSREMALRIKPVTATTAK